MGTVDLHTARGAVRRSAATRAKLRGRTPDDRDDQLRAALEDLSAAMRPLEAVLRSGSHTGRSLRHPRERAAADAIQAERAKVRGMLRRASGGRQRQRTPYRSTQFRAAVGAAVRDANNIERELDHVLPQLRQGTQEYRREAERLLAVLDRLSQRLVTARAKARYWSAAGAWGRIKPADQSAADTAKETQQRVTELRRRAKEAIAVPIDIGFSKAKTPKKATPAKRRRWTDEEAWAAMVAFTIDSGRPPRAADFRNNPDLPSYAKVHDLFGGIPADDLRDDAARAQSQPT